MILEKRKMSFVRTGPA